MSTHLEVHVISVGGDRLCTLPAYVAHSLARGLSASGNNRTRFKPLDREDSGKYSHTARDQNELVSLLRELPGLVIVCGHGTGPNEDPDGEDGNWELHGTATDLAVSIDTLAEHIGPAGIPADALLVDACYAHDARKIWHRLLNAEGVLLTTKGEIGVETVTQWIAGLLTAIANQPGKARPTRAEWQSAHAATKTALGVYEVHGGVKTPTKRELPSNAVSITY